MFFRQETTMVACTNRKTEHTAAAWIGLECSEAKNLGGCCG